MNWDFRFASTLITSSPWNGIFDILLDVYYTSKTVECQVNSLATKALRHEGPVFGEAYLVEGEA
jgi:hypothetical protein